MESLLLFLKVIGLSCFISYGLLYILSLIKGLPWILKHFPTSFIISLLVVLFVSAWGQVIVAVLIQKGN